MPMEQVPVSEPITKSEFHKRLREWFKSGERQIGPEYVDGRKSWVHVRDGSTTFGLHADTKRDAVDRYLQLVKRHGDDLIWEKALSRRGNLTAVVFGPERVRITSFYLYVVRDAA